MEKLDLVGEGGTDFRPAFAYIDELIATHRFTELKGVIYFTDGQGIYPQKMPPYPDRVCIYGRRGRRTGSSAVGDETGSG